jgi:DNA polymerase elongation subunit (family B)
LALRRDDTPLFVANAQYQIFRILARERDPSRLPGLFPEVLDRLRERIHALNNRNVPIEELLVTQRLSRELDEYRVPSPVARAACQLQAIGKNVQMGQRIQFLYTRTEQGVCAWDLPEPFNPALIDTARYKELLFRAAHEVLQPLGVPERVLRNWLFIGTSYLVPPGLLHHRLEMPLFAGLQRLRLDSM